MIVLAALDHPLDLEPRGTDARRVGAAALGDRGVEDGGDGPQPRVVGAHVRGIVHRVRVDHEVRQLRVDRVEEGIERRLVEPVLVAELGAVELIAQMS